MISAKDFQNHLSSIADFPAEKKLAVALSGGGDSMALGFLMSRYCKKNKIELHLLTVDHGLRPEAFKEAKQVSIWVKDWPGCVHKILRWKGEKPKARIQEAARDARYALMEEYCKKNKIAFLFLAHHAEDQAETFLFRLAKGSGIDGLSVMPVRQDRGGIQLIRPCLEWKHHDLLAVCNKNKISWIEDPSNNSEKYARVRLRQSKAILEQEGLTLERILALAKRLERARNALDQMADKAWENAIVVAEPRRIELRADQLKSNPEEIVLRLLQRALQQIAIKKKYPPSLQRLEEITHSLLKGNFNAATLANCVIRLKKARNLIEIIPE